ncbi:MAG TPA: hypothetical protein VML94_06470 [Thermoplasmata archaeon]|nr:hypothetical protein [Thermoplasmata archaeon]
MVVPSLTIGALVGILLSGGFVYWEVGRFATPQVPVTRFDERREMFAYTAGLFVGVPLAVAFVLFRLELAGAALIGALGILAALIAGTEGSQLLLIRSRFWSGEARPFYALGFRAAIGGILALALVASYLSGPVAVGVPLAAVAVSAVALVALEVAGALLSLRPDPASGLRGGGPWSGALVGAVGFFLLGLGPIAGPDASLAAAAMVAVGSALVYRRLRPFLDRVAVPPPPPTPTAPGPPSAYGRTEEPLASTAPPTSRR